MAMYQGFLFLILVLLVSIAADATQYKVGGSKGWAVPDDPNEYNQWAQKRRFQVGDSLVFVYLPDTDSVLLVDEDSYRNCNTSSYIDSFDDGNTVFVFTRSGPYHFISGNNDRCVKNESLVVVVMADRTTKGSGMAPSPSASSSSSPPAPNSVVFVPTASPNGEGSNSNHPSKNGVSTKVVSLVGSVGAIIGYFFVL